ncbi:acyltransferase [Parvularcula sp. IMCC14364]|uniref:acyltransferase family protein n=1 Tax=Parvularcula sp. IMCC14364 TaxID=3067902 RepID=UPI0027426EE3|nr:acyltransferase [Parvularcula sp. IMCC14364]
MTVTPLPPAGSRLTNLDGLRGLAAMAVLLYHYTSVFPRFWPEAQPPGFVIDFGGFGVHLFFIISGFVILMTLERRGATRAFLKSRFIRLYPIFWVCVTFTFLILILFPVLSAGPDWLTYLVNLTMLQDYIKVQPVDSVYWSLTYELGSVPNLTD